MNKKALQALLDQLELMDGNFANKIEAADADPQGPASRASRGQAWLADHIKKFARDLDKIEKDDGLTTKGKAQRAQALAEKYVAQIEPELKKTVLDPIRSTVDKLEAEGFLRRKRSKKDRRVVKVEITAKGKKIHKELLNRRDDEIENLYGNLSETDRIKLTRALKTVLGILERIINKYYN